jgi:tRNA threonylcarbamoyladenosine biosynthesis protein TsaB
LCGADLLAAGKLDNVMNLEPLYIRRAEAEVLWEKRHGLLSGN